MKTFLLGLIFFIFWIPINAQTIHWITFTEMNPFDTIASKCARETRNILYSEWINKVNAALALKGYQIDIQDYYGKMVSPKNCKEVIMNLKCWSEDIIVFYYIGHGRRAAYEKDIFPEINLSKGDREKGIPLSQIHEILLNNNARLTITIGMSCNTMPISSSRQYAYISSFSDIKKDLEVKNIQDLFLGYKGNIIFSSNAPGEKSYGDCPFNNTIIDRFSSNLIKQFSIQMNNANSGTWEDLFYTIKDRVSSQIERKIKRERIINGGEKEWNFYSTTQTPQYAISVKRISNSTILPDKNLDSSKILINPFLKNFNDNIIQVNYDISETFEKAERLYLEKKYEEAFPLFRRLAYANRSALKAQYYTALMESEGKGGKLMHPLIRNNEASWLCLKGAFLAQKKYEEKLYSHWQSTYQNESYEEWFKGVDDDFLNRIWQQLDTTTRELFILKRRLITKEKKMPYYGTDKYFYFYTFQRPINKGYMVVKRRNRYGYVSENKKNEIKCNFSCAYGFNDNGLALVQKKNLFGYIDTTGRLKFGEYTSACEEFKDGKTFAILNETLHLINEEGVVLRKISGYKDIIKPALDNYILVTNLITGKYDLFDFYGNLIEIGCNKIEYKSDFTIKVYKNDKLVYSCYKNW